MHRWPVITLRAPPRVAALRAFGTARDPGTASNTAHAADSTLATTAGPPPPLTAQAFIDLQWLERQVTSSSLAKKLGDNFQAQYTLDTGPLRRFLEQGTAAALGLQRAVELRDMYSYGSYSKPEPALRNMDLVRCLTEDGVTVRTFNVSNNGLVAAPAIAMAVDMVHACTIRGDVDNGMPLSSPAAGSTGERQPSSPRGSVTSLRSTDVVVGVLGSPHFVPALLRATQHGRFTAVATTQDAWARLTGAIKDDLKGICVQVGLEQAIESMLVPIFEFRATALPPSEVARALAAAVVEHRGLGVDVSGTEVAVVLTQVQLLKELRKLGLTLKQLVQTHPGLFAFRIAKDGRWSVTVQQTPPAAAPVVISVVAPGGAAKQQQQQQRQRAGGPSAGAGSSAGAPGTGATGPRHSNGASQPPAKQGTGPARHSAGSPAAKTSAAVAAAPTVPKAAVSAPTALASIAAPPTPADDGAAASPAAAAWVASTGSPLSAGAIGRVFGSAPPVEPSPTEQPSVDGDAAAAATVGDAATPATAAPASSSFQPATAPWWQNPSVPAQAATAAALGSGNVVKRGSGGPPAWWKGPSPSPTAAISAAVAGGETGHRDHGSRTPPRGSAAAASAPSAVQGGGDAVRGSDGSGSTAATPIIGGCAELDAAEAGGLAPPDAAVPLTLDAPSVPVAALGVSTPTEGGVERDAAAAAVPPPGLVAAAEDAATGAAATTSAAAQKRASAVIRRSKKATAPDAPAAAPSVPPAPDSPASPPPASESAALALSPADDAALYALVRGVHAKRPEAVALGPRQAPTSVKNLRALLALAGVKATARTKQEALAALVLQHAPAVRRAVEGQQQPHQQQLQQHPPEPAVLEPPPPSAESDTASSHATPDAAEGVPVVVEDGSEGDLEVSSGAPVRGLDYSRPPRLIL